MDDLIAFVRAGLDEDEQVALAASPAPWKANAEHDEVLAVDDITVAEGFALSGHQQRATVDHITRWDPTRALAEVKAKRRILDECERAISRWQAGHQQGKDDPAGLGRGHFALTVVVQGMAQPYAGQPGWCEEWAA